MKEINNKLRKLLQGKKLSQLEKETGIFSSQLSIWMRGSDFSTIDMLQKCAIAANMRVYFDGSDDDIEQRLLNIVLFETQNYSTLNLEHMTGVKGNTFWAMRNGMTPRLSTLLKVCEALEIELNFELK